MSQGDEAPPTKKSKDDDRFKLPPLDQFKIVEILAQDINRKSACLHLEEQKDGAKVPDGKGGFKPYRNEAVILLEKKPFSKDDFVVLMDSEKTKLRRIVQNEQYAGYDVELPAEHNGKNWAVDGVQP